MDRVQRPAFGSTIFAAVVVGLGWGLGLGLIDSLPALLEGDLAAALGRRLLVLVYVAVFDALAFGLLLALTGSMLWLVARFLEWDPDRAVLLGLYTGLCAAVSAGMWIVHRYPDASPVVGLGLALFAGFGLGGMVYAAQSAAVEAGPPAPGPALGELLVLTLWTLCLFVLVGTALYHQIFCDWPGLNPPLTDQAPTPERPNIVLISIDALRADRLGVYGHGTGGVAGVSPSIDELARRGLIFRQAVAQGSSTVPSVSSFLTSLYPTEVGMITGRKWSLDEMRITLAEALQVTGYRTQAYVTNGHLVPARGYAQGFDGYVAPDPGRPYGLDRLAAETSVAGLACRHGTAVCDLFGFGYQLLFDRLLVLENGGERVNDRARRFIRLHRDEQFFLWLHYMEPHAAYRPRKVFGGLPPSIDAAREEFLRAWQPSNKTVPTVLGDDDLVALTALYDGEILDVDRWVGGIWDEIAIQGLADRTLLVITADHGDEFGEHGDYGHGHTVYQELTWVPLIVVGPQVRDRGRVVDEPVPLLDIMPTLLAVAGASLPDGLQGQSLLPVLQGAEPARRAIYSESPARRSTYDDRSLRLGDDKLVYNVKLDRAELYDLEADPGEQTDLAAVEAERAAAMRADLRAWMADVLASWATLPRAGGQSEELDAALEEALRQIGY